MTRIVNVALGQLGPVQKADSRAAVVARYGRARVVARIRALEGFRR